ncbi:MAG: STAS domain-containing protein [Planctomycetes bacterium]|nr:STAS domain-containing protein [Planctomycetota bacterium]
MEITENKRNNIIILELKGNLNVMTTNLLEEKFTALIEHGERLLVVDFSRLDYISSAGLRVFLIAAKKLKNVNGKIALSSLKPQIKEVFDIAGFSSIFSIFNSQEDAVHGLQ